MAGPAPADDGGAVDKWTRKFERYRSRLDPDFEWTAEQMARVERDIVQRAKERLHRPDITTLEMVPNDIKAATMDEIRHRHRLEALVFDPDDPYLWGDAHFMVFCELNTRDSTDQWRAKLDAVAQRLAQDNIDDAWVSIRVIMNGTNAPADQALLLDAVIIPWERRHADRLRVVKLSITKCGVWNSRQIILRGLHSLRHLVKLQLYNVNLVFDPTRPNVLIRRSLDEAVPPIWPNLLVLEIDVNNTMREISNVPLSRSAPMLSALSLTDCEQIRLQPHATGVGALDDLSELRRLVLRRCPRIGCDPVTDAVGAHTVFTPAFCRLPHLAAVFLSYLPGLGVNPPMPEEFVRHMLGLMYKNGYNPQLVVQNKVFSILHEVAYDPASNAWNQAANFMIDAVNRRYSRLQNALVLAAAGVRDLNTSKSTRNALLAQGLPPRPVTKRIPPEVLRYAMDEYDLGNRVCVG